MGASQPKPDVPKTPTLVERRRYHQENFGPPVRPKETQPVKQKDATADHHYGMIHNDKTSVLSKHSDENSEFPVKHDSTPVGAQNSSEIDLLRQERLDYLRTQHCENRDRTPHVLDSHIETRQIKKSSSEEISFAHENRSTYSVGEASTAGLTVNKRRDTESMNPRQWEIVRGTERVVSDIINPSMPSSIKNDYSREDRIKRSSSLDCDEPDDLSKPEKALLRKNQLPELVLRKPRIPERLHYVRQHQPTQTIGELKKRKDCDISIKPKHKTDFPSKQTDVGNTRQHERVSSLSSDSNGPNEHRMAEQAILRRKQLENALKENLQRLSTTVHRNKLLTQTNKAYDIPNIVSTKGEDLSKPEKELLKHKQTVFEEPKPYKYAGDHLTSASMVDNTLQEKPAEPVTLKYVGTVKKISVDEKRCPDVDNMRNTLSTDTFTQQGVPEREFKGSERNKEKLICVGPNLPLPSPGRTNIPELGLGQHCVDFPLKPPQQAWTQTKSLIYERTDSCSKQTKVDHGRHHIQPGSPATLTSNDKLPTHASFQPTNDNKQSHRRKSSALTLDENIPILSAHKVPMIVDVSSAVAGENKNTEPKPCVQSNAHQSLSDIISENHTEFATSVLTMTKMPNYLRPMSERGSCQQSLQVDVKDDGRNQVTRQEMLATDSCNQRGSFEERFSEMAIKQTFGAHNQSDQHTAIDIKAGDDSVNHKSGNNVQGPKQESSVRNVPSVPPIMTQKKSKLVATSVKQQGDQKMTTTIRHLENQKMPTPVTGQENQKLVTPVKQEGGKKVGTIVKQQEYQKMGTAVEQQENQKVDTTVKQQENPKVDTTVKQQENLKVVTPVKQEGGKKVGTIVKQQEYQKMGTPVEQQENQKVDTTVKQQENPKMGTTVKQQENPKIDTTVKQQENQKVDSTVKQKDKKAHVVSTVKQQENQKVATTVKQQEHHKVTTTAKQEDDKKVTKTMKQENQNVSTKAKQQQIPKVARPVKQEGDKKVTTIVKQKANQNFVTTVKQVDDKRVAKTTKQEDQKVATTVNQQENQKLATEIKQKDVIKKVATLLKQKDLSTSHQSSVEHPKSAYFTQEVNTPVPSKTRTRHRNRNRKKKDKQPENGNSQQDRKIGERTIKTPISATGAVVGDHSKKNMSKQTYLYLVFMEKITQKESLNGFIKHRMGNKKTVEFEIMKVMKQRSGQCDIVVLLLPSRTKAMTAKRLIEISNRRCMSSRIACYLTQYEADNIQVVDPRDEEALKEKVIEELFEKAKEEFQKHDAKIKKKNEEIAIREKNLKAKRGLSLDQYEKNSNEKKALEDRLNELELQKKEFVGYLQAMKTKLKEMENVKDFDGKVGKIRKDFGIECKRLRTALPMYARREEILTTVMENQVSVLLGETGSGKSTQIVQYLYQAGFANEGLIACTQPRKIAAVSLATHVSTELAASVGQEVGYKVGMQMKKTSLTKIMFMTDHVLLNECLQDENFSAYSCVIIDEAHERSIHTDLLLGMLKKCLTTRPDLKVVITSATIDPDIFVRYFGGPQTCPVVKVSGRTFPVDVFWEPDDPFSSPFPEEYEEKAINKTIEVHRGRPVAEGDILVFLTSPVEIEKCCNRFKKIVAGNDYECLPLHGKLDTSEQKRVFEQLPTGQRKIVFATNSAETSITIPGIKFVIDTGVAKEMRYDPKKNMNSLDVRPVSQSSANQRKGRAGRTASGICYRLYSQSNFASMDKSSQPEILRVHLGQSILKLMELGVNIISFDFVEQPDLDAMYEALKMLHDIDAIMGGNITDLGKWIAKLPVEPRLGLLIKKGIDADIPLEGIIVASSSSQSSVFYRGGSEQQKKMSDMKKVPFAHTGGDLLTILDVFRAWEKVPENQKNSWCFNNSVNAKTIKGIRELVKETLWILNKDLGMKIKYELKNDSQADGVIQKIIFQCTLSNLSLYLGHENAGYIIADRHLHVQIHPSSSLRALALQPRWVVYSQLVKTSQDFITNITPVPEEYVEEAIAEGKVQMDMEKFQKMQVKQVSKRTVGKHVFWKFVGPQHKNRREVEETISLACNETLVVIEAEKIRGEISLYCTEIFKDIAAEIFHLALEETSTQLMNETIEEHIGKVGSGVRVLLRSGGTVVNILMPNQYRTCQIREKVSGRYDVSERYVEDILRDFGDIEQLWRAKGQRSTGGFWGKVTFLNYEDAVYAVSQVNEQNDLDFTLEPVKADTHASRRHEFKLKLQWCRRKTRGHCFVKLDRPEDEAGLLGTMIEVNDIPATVKIPRRAGRADLLIEPIGSEVKEEQVKQALSDALGINLEANRSRFQIIIPRHNAVIGPEDREMIKQKLANKIMDYVPRNTFSLFVRDFKQQTAFCSAEASFTDISECEKVAKGFIINDVEMYGSLIDVDQEFKGSVFLPKHIYTASKRDIDNFLTERKQKRSTTSVFLRTMKSGNLSIDMKACSPARLAKIKVMVDELIAGDIVDLELAPHGQGMFTVSARQELEKIRKRTGTIIVPDERRMKVTVQGLSEKRQTALHLIEVYLESIAKAAERQIALKGEGNPPGFMKALLVKYGLSLHKLRDSTSLVAIQLNLRQHELTLVGEGEALKVACEEVEKVRQYLIEHAGDSVPDSDDADCPICLCPIDVGELDRLEYCGHPYCSTCLSEQVRNAVTSKSFPISCCVEGCGKVFVARDLLSQLKKGTINRSQLVDAALGFFITQHSNDYAYCITPDCAMVFRKTSSGEMFYCSLCLTSLCTTCLIPYHDGLSCAMYQSEMKTKNTLDKWLKEKPDKRKLCPKCEVGIEKIEGCDHMTCKCGAHICWKCMKYFDSGQACYGHLAVAHGSFV